MGSSNKLKAFARLDAQKRIVSGSVIWRRNMPKVGNWLELQGNQCCNPTTTTTAIPFDCVTYGVTVARGESGTYTYTPCGDTEPLGPVAIEGPVSLAMCSVADSISSTGDVVITVIGECETTTTTSTTTTSAG